MGSIRYIQHQVTTSVAVNRTKNTGLIYLAWTERDPPEDRPCLPPSKRCGDWNEIGLRDGRGGGQETKTGVQRQATLREPGRSGDRASGGEGEPEDLDDSGAKQTGEWTAEGADEGAGKWFARTDGKGEKRRGEGFRGRNGERKCDLGRGDRGKYPRVQIQFLFF